jgi:acylaminoacyl-peptidase
MRNCSPGVHVKNVRAPVLMLIGGKDRRVPQSQGISYYHSLKAKGVITKLLQFPEDVHAIDRPLSEAEQWIAIADWLQTYLI